MVNKLTNTASPFDAIPGFLVCIPYEEKLEGPFIVSDSAKSRELMATVLEVGADVESEYSGGMMHAPCKKNDVIIHSAYMQEPFRHWKTGQLYKFISFREVRAVLKQQKQKDQ